VFFNRKYSISFPSGFHSKVIGKIQTFFDSLLFYADILKRRGGRAPPPSPTQVEQHVETFKLNSMRKIQIRIVFTETEMDPHEFGLAALPVGGEEGVDDVPHLAEDVNVLVILVLQVLLHSCTSVVFGLSSRDVDFKVIIFGLDPDTDPDMTLLKKTWNNLDNFG